jgi:hypothetical protein
MIGLFQKILRLGFGIDTLSKSDNLSAGPTADALLLETGDFILLETGDFLLLE